MTVRACIALCVCLFVSVVILLTDFKLEQSHSHMLVFSFIANFICMRIPSVGLFIARALFFTFYLFFLIFSNFVCAFNRNTLCSEKEIIPRILLL